MSSRVAAFLIESDCEGVKGSPSRFRGGMVVIRALHQFRKRLWLKEKIQSRHPLFVPLPTRRSPCEKIRAARPPHRFGPTVDTATLSKTGFERRLSLRRQALSFGPFVVLGFEVENQYRGVEVVRVSGPRNRFRFWSGYGSVRFLFHVSKGFT